MAGCGSGSGGGTSAPPVGNPPPPPPSGGASTAVIVGVTFDASSHLRAAQGSDNWPMTWSDDDQQYAMWGDGGGFGGSENDGRVSLGVARIEGDGGAYDGVNRMGGKDGECQSRIDGKAHGAPLSIGGVLYAWITPGSGAGGFDSFTLYRSNDKGCAWTPLAVTFTNASDHIGYGSFVQFGKDNSAAPDAYVYTIATEVADTSSLTIVQRPGRVMLVRVPATAIEDRGAYEFYAGLDSSDQPQWSTSSADRLAIYEDLDGVGPFPQMTFVPGLERMVYTNQHGSGSTNAGAQSLLTMAEAPQPWGPWSVFYHDAFLPQVESSVFQWNFAPKWFRTGGREFTLVFSGSGSNDSWNTIDGVFTTQ
ncbi:MAG TPA: hypothetical protein VH814_19320 [Steroidobacteraceae bacterium]